jgi:hypothetical protein
MARWLLLVFVLVVFAQAASGVSDPRPDVLGVYFDYFGDQICEDNLLIAVPFSVWFVYTNPSETSILGFEAGYHTTAEFFQLGIFPPCGIIWTEIPELDNLFVACAEPMATTEATVLFRIEYLMLGFENPDSIFYLEKARESTQPGTNPYIILADGSLMEAQAGMTAYTTLCCGLPTENRGWGSIKSLYR